MSWANPVLRDREIRGRALFARLDLNMDGKITLQETLAPRGITFRKIDVNRDGYLRNGEYMAYVYRYGIDWLSFLLGQRDVRQAFSAMDKDLDGYLSRAEYRAPAYLFVARYDQNGDRRIAQQEYLDLILFQARPNLPNLSARGSKLIDTMRKRFGFEAKTQ